MAVSPTVARAASQIASMLGERRMRLVATLNKHVTNPIVLLWAGRVAGMAVVEHVGRRSGRRYRTPVMAIVSGQRFWVVLNYGAGSDWVTNVLAAQGASIRHRGRQRRLEDVRVEPASRSSVPLPDRFDDEREVLSAILRDA
ncbi:nitroreductase family deazaflavin-dependent oxidoreductase [Gordonia lacunae]|uniref:Nitroreductase family deazaflavin-dependent oxidoreductase n=1 Tax=Gordonia lacunae TaxID=417102 RepID=A0A243QAH6_9ACTN|nr:nitroreductase family deazaflavin-dependent oxidoreductase [Gordonia lacunae]OUC78723.1 nitroreductase family deazaflavin-dependent oxidoreductase [Gordonia lacunae]